MARAVAQLIMASACSLGEKQVVIIIGDVIMLEACALAKNVSQPTNNLCMRRAIEKCETHEKLASAALRSACSSAVGFISTVHAGNGCPDASS